MTKTKSPNRLTVLFVGKRPGAFRAARHLNLNVLVLAETPPKRKEVAIVDAYLPADFSDPTVDWETVAWQIGAGRKIAAVFALTERTVKPAAMIRQSLGIAGMHGQVAQRCVDKFIMKNAVRARGVRCADYLTTDARLPSTSYLDRLGLPLVLKSRVGSGGRGTQIFFDQQALPEAFPGGWLAESFVEGIEMSVESLVYRGVPIFTNFTEYLKPGWANIVPAPLQADVAASVQATNADAIRALGIPSGLTHLEIFLTPEGVFFGELAARPPGGHIMALIEQAYEVDLWQAWFETELGCPPHLPTQASRSAGVWILHPGQGRVTRLSGHDQALAVEGVKRVSLRVQVGDEVGQRQGVGQEVGHILVCGADRDQVAARLAKSRQSLQIEVTPSENSR